MSTSIRAARITFLLTFMMIASPLLAGLAGTDLFIPASGRVSGAGGSEFYTTLWITNPGVAPVNVDIQFYRAGQANALPAGSFRDTIAAKETKKYENYVESLFGITGVLGAARFVSTADVLVAARIYNQHPGSAMGWWRRWQQELSDSDPRRPGRGER